MTETTLEAVKAKQTELAEMIARIEEDLKKPNFFEYQGVRIPLNHGEIYVGTITTQGEYGSYHLILQPGSAENKNWQDAMDWANEAGGELPNRVECALLFATLKNEFKEVWHWTRERHVSDSDYAWVQLFHNGYQYYGTTPTSRAQPEPSADGYARHHADFTFTELAQAYFDCREHKRNSATALAFEQNLERNLRCLFDELQAGTYLPGRSICFVITRPKPREVWAAEFRDRIVHHLLHNRIAPRFYRSFIADSCACIPGRGTLYAAERLETKVRSITQNWQRPAHYLKCDLANFFVSIDKRIVLQQLAKRISEPWWLQLAELILMHDPRQNYEFRGDTARIELVPAHKRLTSQPAHLGLPIGNLSSQFFANVYLDVLDQFVKHRIGARHYIRYVDDFVLLHESPQWLNAAHDEIAEFLPERLGAKLNPKKTIRQQIKRGIDFVGQVISPHCRTTRRRTRDEALLRVRDIHADDVFETANSYFGLMRQATHSHHDRALLANVLRDRGHCIKADLTKTYRRNNQCHC